MNTSTRSVQDVLERAAPLADGRVAHALISAWRRQRTAERLLALLAGEAQATAVAETAAAARPYLLASIAGATGRQVLIVTATPDTAERFFTDLLYYLGDEGGTEVVALLRARDETVGALESPSERSARMTLLSDLVARKRRCIVAPLAAIRQYFMPRARFEASLFTVKTGADVGWEMTQQRLFDLGYRRAEVVSAAGEYAVRGGILDLFASNAPAPVRIEFFGDRVESLREFDLQTQRSHTEIERTMIAPWS
ncbi:MAG: hypothetical protein JOZ97_07300, partial [Candidatus Eremiobacteraeota bacterium]|nr:hypothetical protein [Candidatus Eremiobacteraeota bacterium]